MNVIPEKHLKNGFTMPSFGLGTWGFGGWTEPDLSGDDEAVTAIKHAIDTGITHIDTAERYARGHTEELVAEAIDGLDRRRLFLVSKVSPEHIGYDDLLRSAEASLRRLNTGYLDLYLIHDPNQEIPVQESMRAMNRLVDEGFIRAIGVSNFTSAQWEEAARVSAHPIVANQVHYNLHIRPPEEILAHATSRDWMLIAWRPIRDVLRMETRPKVLNDLCIKYGKTPAQIGVQWLLRQHNVVTLAQCGTAEHLEEVLDGLGWSLDPADAERLRTDFPQELLPPHTT